MHNSNYPADAGAQSGKMADQTFSAANASRNLNANQFRCKGYTFDGWTTGEGDFYSDGAAFTQTVENEGKVILYAQWEKLADVTIFYTPEPTSLGTVELNPTESNELDPQDGMVSESLNPETGEVQGATAVPGEGSVFVGWYDAQDTERSHPLTGGSTTYTPERDSSGRYQDGSYVALFRLKQYVLHAPMGDGGVYEYVEPWYGFAVKKESDAQDYAVEFLRFMARQDELNTLASIKGVPSAAKETTDERYTALNDIDKVEMKVVSDGTVPAYIGTLLSHAANELLDGSIASADDAVASFVARCAESTQGAD